MHVRPVNLGVLFAEDDLLRIVPIEGTDLRRRRCALCTTPLQCLIAGHQADELPGRTPLVCPHNSQPEFRGGPEVIPVAKGQARREDVPQAGAHGSTAWTEP